MNLKRRGTKCHDFRDETLRVTVQIDEDMNSGLVNFHCYRHCVGSVYVLKVLDGMKTVFVETIHRHRTLCKAKDLEFRAVVGTKRVEEGNGRVPKLLEMYPILNRSVGALARNRNL